VLAQTYDGQQTGTSEEPTGMAASLSLIIEDDAGKQIVVPFAKDVITIGRKEGNTIRLTERNVSRFHAKLEKQQGGVLVEDLSSFNGVKLNGDRIAGRVLVSAGDVIEIGDYHLELRAAQQARGAPPPLGPIGSKAGSFPDAGSVAGDDFEGDTQRWEPPSASSSGQATMEDSQLPAGGGFADGAGDTERLDLQHLQSLASQGGQSAPAPKAMAAAQSWPPPQPRVEAPPLAPFSLSDLEATARQPVANVPLGGTAPPTLPSLAVAAHAHEETQDLPLPVAPAPTLASSPPRATPLQARPRPSEETEQLRAAPPPNPADDLSIPRIVVLNTIFSGSTFPLRAMENVLGRTDENDIVLEHRSVSRNHAKLVREGERVRILDLKSANGVLVNGVEVEQQVLKAGDIIELGRLKLRFVPVGERFVVAPEEIERSRLQDAAGDEGFDDSAQTLNVTSPLRSPLGDPLATVRPRPVALYAMLAGLVIVVLVLTVILLKRGGDPPTPTQTQTPAPTTLGAADDALPAVAPIEVSPTPTPTPSPSPTPPPTPVAAVTEPAVVPVVEPTKPPAEKPRPKSVDRDPDFDGTLKEAQSLIIKGDNKKAIALLKKLEAKRKEDPQVQRNLGIAYAKQRDNKLATKHYQRYLELDPAAHDAEQVRAILNDAKR